MINDLILNWLLVRGPVGLEDMLIFFNTFYEINIQTSLTFLQDCGKIWIDQKLKMVYLRTKDFKIPEPEYATPRRRYRRRKKY